MSTYTPIASVTLSSAQSSVTFSGIPQTYTDLVLVCSVKVTTGTPDMQIAINSDSGSNYSRTGLYGDGSTANSFRQSSQTILGILTADATNFTPAIIQFNNYSNATTYKTILQRTGITYPAAQVGLWRSTSAITSIVASTNSSTFTSGTTFNLYGVANASITNVAKATGGDSVYTDGTYWYHIFRSSGTFTPIQALTADYLVVAGAGGGGGVVGGGGGAGGLRCTVTATGGGGSLESALSLTAQAYTVTVGAGGAGGASNANGVSGSNSVFSTITSTGGGGGGYNTNNGLTGGSGGGGANANGTTAGTGGAGTANQGFAGGNANNNAFPNGASGGGGGAGSVGAAASGATGGAGGSGVSTSITGSSVAYAGGGGGWGGTTAGTATAGGGASASGSGSANGSAGTANTGGGGGGAANGGNGGAGGSGIVIVRYAA